MAGSHYEISPREREDEQRRDFHEFDHVDETYDEHIRRVTEARLSERPKAGNESATQRRQREENVLRPL